MVPHGRAIELLVEKIDWLKKKYGLRFRGQPLIRFEVAQHELRLGELRAEGSC
jgi:hypothetical protein